MNPLSNSDRDLLRLAAGSRDGISAFDAFTAKYATSKQPGKKVAGIYRQLHSLARRGLLREAAFGRKFTGSRFVLTAEGRRAWIEGSERNRELWAVAKPAFPRLAKETT